MCDAEDFFRIVTKPLLIRAINIIIFLFCVDFLCHYLYNKMYRTEPMVFWLCVWSEKNSLERIDFAS